MGRRVALVLVVAIAAGLGLWAGGLGSRSPVIAAPPPSRPAADSTFQVVQDEGRLIIGIGQEAAPFGFSDKEELVGFDVDIAHAVAARLETYAGGKLQVLFRPVTDETRISWVQSGEVHLSICHTNITRKHDALIDFTVPYGWDGKGVLYDARKGPRKLADFAGKVIGIKRSSSSEGEIQAYFDAQGWTRPQLRQFDSHAAGIQALVYGQIDGFTDDNSIVISTATKAGYKVGPDQPLVITETLYSPAYYGIGVQQNDSRWRDTLNYCLHDLWNSGQYRQIYEKWFGPDSMCPMPLGNHHMEPYVPG